MSVIKGTVLRSPPQTFFKLYSNFMQLTTLICCSSTKLKTNATNNQGSPLRNSLHLLYKHFAAALADEFNFSFAVEAGAGSCQCSYGAEEVPSDRSADEAFDRLIPLVLSNRYATCASAKNVWTSDPGHISYPLSSKLIIQPGEH